ncbi:MAG TPA: twin-arginine translocase subunit TatC [Bryobacteraceae bacterium]|nr:twin-arginine translocase subunit TatC [Bryobacteraceae bacterium]
MPDEEDEMLRMSFMEHLAELRSRIFRALAGLGVAFALSMIFMNPLWHVVSRPAEGALRQLGLPSRLVYTTPTEAFSTVWVKLPLLASLFLASPWVLYQLWAFISPGLYVRERRWAVPFVVSTAALFVGGGLFAYFVVFRYSLVFLLGVGRDLNVQSMVSMSEYFNLFMDVTVGVGMVFELPVLLFLLTALHVVSPGFLLRQSRYFILGITIVAAIITPTQDAVNLGLLVVPLCVLFFVGVLASWLLQRYRRRASLRAERP